MEAAVQSPAAGGCAADEHDAKTQTAEHAAVQHGHQRFDHRDGQQRKQVDQHGAEGHAQQRTGEEPLADFQTAQDKQGQVDEDGQNTHRTQTGEFHKNQCQTGDATGIHFIGLQKK